VEKPDLSRRTTAICRTAKPQYLRKGLTDFDDILWYSNAFWPRKLHRPLKLPFEESQYGQRPTHGNRKICISRQRFDWFPRIRTLSLWFLHRTNTPILTHRNSLTYLLTNDSSGTELQTSVDAFQFERRLLQLQRWWWIVEQQRRCCRPANVSGRLGVRLLSNKRRSFGFTEHGQLRSHRLFTRLHVEHSAAPVVKTTTNTSVHTDIESARPSTLLITDRPR